MYSLNVKSFFPFLKNKLIVLHKIQQATVFRKFDKKSEKWHLCNCKSGMEIPCEQYCNTSSEHWSFSLRIEIQAEAKNNSDVRCQTAEAERQKRNHKEGKTSCQEK